MVMNSSGRRSLANRNSGPKTGQTSRPGLTIMRINVAKHTNALRQVKALNTPMPLVYAYLEAGSKRLMAQQPSSRKISAIINTRLAARQLVSFAHSQLHQPFRKL